MNRRVYIDVTQPDLRCDFCQRRIRRPSDGVIDFAVVKVRGRWRPAGPRHFLHKGRCARLMKEWRVWVPLDDGAWSRGWGWRPLSWLSRRSAARLGLLSLGEGRVA